MNNKIANDLIRYAELVEDGALISPEEMNCASVMRLAAEALAQPAAVVEPHIAEQHKQSTTCGEPVAYFNPQVKGGFYWAKPTKITAPVTVNVEPMPLYTTPPPVAEPHKRKPLTDEQLMVALLHVDADAKRLPIGFRAFARAIEAAHGIHPTGFKE